MEQKTQQNAVMKQHSECIERVLMYQYKMKAATQRIADYLVENEDSFYDLNCEQLAENTKTSPATVIRFSKLLGYNGFADMRFHAQREQVVLHEYNIDVQAGEDLNTVKQKAIHFTQTCIEECLMNTSNDAFAKAVDLICQAEQVLLCGSGSSSGVCTTATGTFLAIGISALSLPDPILQMRRALLMKPSDVVIGINYDGYMKDTVDTLMVAQKAGVSTIVISTVPDSLLCKYADVVLYTTMRKNDNALNQMVTGICQMSILQVLQIGVWLKMYPGNKDIIHQMIRHTEMKRYQTELREIEERRVRQ